LYIVIKVSFVTMFKGVYTPKYHQDQLYYNIFKNHWTGFLNIYEQRFASQYGPLEKYQIKTIEQFIRCGDPKHGFAWLECPKCHESFLVPFSCKTKVCNSCGEKHSLVWSEWVASEVMLNVNHRHITLTIPVTIRNYFFKNSLLLKKFLETACNMLYYVYTQSCADKRAKPGIIAVLHTSGGKLNFNPHIHTLITEGLLSERTNENGEPIIYPLCRPHFRQMNLLWRNKVLALLKNMRIIDEQVVDKYKNQYPKGFYIDVRFKELMIIGRNEKSWHNI